MENEPLIAASPEFGPSRPAAGTIRWRLKTRGAYYTAEMDLSSSRQRHAGLFDLLGWIFLEEQLPRSFAMQGSK